MSGYHKNSPRNRRQTVKEMLGVHKIGASPEKALAELFSQVGRRGSTAWKDLERFYVLCQVSFWDLEHVFSCRQSLDLLCLSFILWFRFDIPPNYSERNLTNKKGCPH